MRITIVNNNIAGATIIVPDEDFANARYSDWVRGEIVDGWVRDAGLGVFAPRRPYASWTLAEDGQSWEPPVERPEGNVIWNEETQAWDPAPEDLEGTPEPEPEVDHGNA